MKRLVSWTAAGYLLFASPLFAEDALYRVVELTGTAEIADAVSGSWRPLEKKEALTAGVKLRTGPDSFLDLVRDAHFENVLRVGPLSAVVFLNARPLRISLDAGSIYLLKEEHRYLEKSSHAPSGIRVLTRDFLAELRQGGCELASAPQGAILRVFSDSVDVHRKTASGYSEVTEKVEEGFRFSVSDSARMEYADYAQWQQWYKKNDERKDSLS